MAGFDNVDPANPCFVCSAGSPVHNGRPAHDGQIGPHLVKKIPRSGWTKKIRRSQDPFEIRETERRPSQARRRHQAQVAAVPRRAVQDVPQFAPNFTVYVLPPDAVCLYSEDRKFFLHGELYCALATAIGKGGKSFAELAQRAGEDFPPDKIEEALKRLIERRYIVPASPSSACRRRRLLGEPRPAAGSRRTKSRELPGARRGHRREGRGRTRRGLERAWRSRRQALARPDGHAGQRLSRTAAGRIEPAARVGPYALAAGATLRRLSAGGTGVHPGQDRLLDLPVRSHDPQSRGQGFSRPRTGARRSRFHRSPATRSDKAPSSLPPSKSPRRSPPAFAPS